MKLKNILSLYMNSPNWSELSPRSRQLYGDALKVLDRFMDMDANKITRPMLIDYTDAMHKKPGTLKIAMALLSAVLSYGYDRGLCAYNHAKGIKMPKSTPIKRWTPEECATFEAKAKPHARLVFLMALYTGQRRSDLYHMRIEQYDGRNIRVIQKKTRKLLYIPVHPKLKKELDAMLEERNASRFKKHPYLLSNSHGDPWTDKAISACIVNACKDMGIEGKSIHGLRKTTAAMLAEIGCAPHLIAAITGHASLKEVMLYTAEANQLKMAEDAMERWVNA